MIPQTRTPFLGDLPSKMLTFPEVASMGPRKSARTRSMALFREGGKHSHKKLSSPLSPFSQCTFLQIHVIHFGILNTRQALPEFPGNFSSLIVSLNVLLCPWNPKPEATAQDNDYKRQATRTLLRFPLSQTQFLEIDFTKAQGSGDTQKYQLPPAKTTKSLLFQPISLVVHRGQQTTEHDSFVN